MLCVGLVLSTKPQSPRFTITCNEIFEGVEGIKKWFQAVVPCHHVLSKSNIAKEQQSQSHFAPGKACSQTDHKAMGNLVLSALLQMLGCKGAIEGRAHPTWPLSGSNLNHIYIYIK